ncbi:MAG: hypothetical protein ACRD0K_01825 [Egibacteraceae bacterium]
MLGQFWSGLGGKLADRWVAAVFSPAFAFWAGGLAAWMWRHGWSVAAVERWAASLGLLPAVVQGGLVVGALLAVIASGAVVRALAPSVLRLLEGYWPWWLAPLRWVLVGLRAKAFERRCDRLRELLSRDLADLSAGAVAELVRADERRYRTPGLPGLMMPTRLGNILRAAERWPVQRWGLETTVCWPRLWLLLPEEARKEVSRARASLDVAAELCLWGLLFAAWTVWAWWALPVGFAVAVAAVWRAHSAAAVYGDLVESCFDLYRRALYEAVGWAPPDAEGDERARGYALTLLLWRGTRVP